MTRPTCAPCSWLRPALILGLLLALCYLWGLPQDFTFDSAPLIRDNQRLHPPAPWWRLATTDWWEGVAAGGLYRPATLAVLRLQYDLLGFAGHAWRYGLVNVLLHLAVCLLLWRLARCWLGAGPGPLAAAALFAVHPIAVDVVPNLVGLADLLATAFVLLSLLAWGRYRHRGQARWAIATAAAGLLGLLSKESAVVLFPLIVMSELLQLWPGEQGPGALCPAAAAPAASRRAAVGRFRPLLGGFAILLAMALLWAVTRGQVLAQYGPRQVPALDNPLVLASAATRIFSGIYVLGLYLQHCLWPVNLSAEYSYAQITLVEQIRDPRWIIALAVILLSLFSAWRFWRRGRKSAAAGILWFWGTLLPFANLLLITGTIMGDRLAYLPLCGLCLTAGAMLQWATAAAAAAPRPWRAPLAKLLTGVAIVALAGVTIYRVPAWATPAALARSLVRDAPDSGKAHLALSQDLLLPGPTYDPPASLAHARLAYQILRPLPEPCLDLYIQLGHCYVALGRWQEGAAILGEALERYGGWRVAPGPGLDLSQARRQMAVDPQILLNLGICREHLGDPRGAADAYRLALQVEPVNVPAHRALAQVYRELGDLDAALAQARQAVRLKPADAASALILGQLLAQRGHYEEAVEVLARARKEDDASPAGLELSAALTQASVQWVSQLLTENKPHAADQAAGKAVLLYQVPAAAFQKLLGNPGTNPPATTRPTAPPATVPAEP